MEKEENAGNQHFLLFPHNVFYSITEIINLAMFNLSSANKRTFNLNRHWSNNFDFSKLKVFADDKKVAKTVGYEINPLPDDKFYTLPN